MAVVVSGKPTSWFCLSCLSTIPAGSVQVQYEDATQMDGSGVKTVCEACVPEHLKEEVESKQQSLGLAKRKQPGESLESKGDEGEAEEEENQESAPPTKIPHSGEGGMAIEKYSEYSMVLRGNTEPHKESLKTMGLKYNRNLKQGGPGWIFPNALLPSVQSFVNNPSSLPSSPLPASLASSLPSFPPSSSAPYSAPPPSASPAPGGGSDLKVEPYTAHSIVVRGNTQPFKEALKSLGGSYNPKLKQGGPGWIFPASAKAKVDSFLANPTTAPATPSPAAAAAAASSAALYTEPNGDKSFIVKGDTKPIKDKLSALGGKWNTLNKGWVFPNSLQEKVNEFIASNPSASSSPPSSSSSSSSSPSSSAPPTPTSSSITIEPYSEKALVIRGDTKPHKDKLTALGCKWNGSLKGGCGWIAPKSKQAQIEEFIKSLPAQGQ